MTTRAAIKTSTNTITFTGEDIFLINAALEVYERHLLLHREKDTFKHKYHILYQVYEKLTLMQKRATITVKVAKKALLKEEES